MTLFGSGTVYEITKIKLFEWAAASLPQNRSRNCRARESQFSAICSAIDFKRLAARLICPWAGQRKPKSDFTKAGWYSNCLFSNLTTITLLRPPKRLLRAAGRTRYFLIKNVFLKKAGLSLFHSRSRISYKSYLASGYNFNMFVW